MKFYLKIINAHSNRLFYQKENNNNTWEESPNKNCILKIIRENAIDMSLGVRVTERVKLGAPLKINRKLLSKVRIRPNGEEKGKWK